MSTSPGSIYDASNVKVFRRGEAQAAIVLDDHAMVLRTWTWLEGAAHDGPPPEKVEAFIRDRLSARWEWGARTTLGVLFSWASRRLPVGELSAPEYYTADEEGPMFYATRPSSDPQPFADHIFDRRLIREVVQTWAEEGTSPGSHVVLGIVPVPHAHVLTISCAGIVGVVMCRRPGTEVGTDPLSVEWERNPMVKVAR